MLIWAASAVYDEKTGKIDTEANIVGAGIEQISNYALAIIVIAAHHLRWLTILIIIITHLRGIRL